MGSIIMITMSSSILLSILPSLVSSFSPEDLPFKESKYAFLMSPSASYAYPESASRYVPAYPSSYYEAESASDAQDSLSSAQLLPLPSIVSASSIPFVFGRKGKDKKASIVRGKPTFHKPSAAATSSQSAQSTDSQVDWSSDDMQQHPIDEAPRKSNRSLGQPCSYSSDCGSGCCLLDRTTKIRSCQAQARISERCTSSQVKGDLYVDACPCARGPDFCSSSNRCSL